MWPDIRPLHRDRRSRTPGGRTRDRRVPDRPRGRRGGERQKAPGGGKYRTFGTPAAGSGGRLAFDAVAAEPNGTLFRAQGGRTSALAVSGRDTRTRLQGTFRGFDPPAASGAAIAFRAL